LEDVMPINGTTEKLELALVKIQQELEIAAPPQRVYEAFVNDIARWWSRGYLLGGEATVDLVLEARPGGRLMEVLSNGGGVLWAEVTLLSPGRSIRLGIPEGVLWSGPGYYMLRFEAQQDGAATLLKLEHQCAQPYCEDGHSGYVQGWTDLLAERLKVYVEGGRVDDAVKPA
jgi:uncharacterized protein YndB with AHSA1/START domain